MKTMYITLIAFLLLFQACNNNTTKSKIETLDTIGGLIINSSNLPDGWVLGKGNEFVPKTKAEQNLIAQNNTYIRALLCGNIEEMKRFFYKESLDYYKKYYPDYSDDEILDEFFSEMSSGFVNALMEYEKSDISYNLYVDDVLREIEYGNDYLYVFGICSRIEGYKHDTLTYLHSSESDITLGVSHNNGKNWTFMTMTDEVPSILIMNYPQHVVDEVMGY